MSEVTRGQKRCSGCDRTLPREAFARDRKYPATVQSKCKACKSRRQRELRAARLNKPAPAPHVLTAPPAAVLPPSTRLLAHEMVRLEAQIKRAAAEHRWIDASELDDVRDRIQQIRSASMRREWLS